ncbi:unnamed protein product [Caretta caretta]
MLASLECLRNGTYGGKKGQLELGEKSELGMVDKNFPRIKDSQLEVDKIFLLDLGPLETRGFMMIKVETGQISVTQLQFKDRA